VLAQSAPRGVTLRTRRVLGRPDWPGAFPERIRPASLIEPGEPPAHPRHGRIALCSRIVISNPALEPRNALPSGLVQVGPTRQVALASRLGRLPQPRATSTPATRTGR